MKIETLDEYLTDRLWESYCTMHVAAFGMHPDDCSICRVRGIKRG